MATLVETFQAIANGLRSMLGQASTTKYTPAQMASTLSGITNRGAVSQTLNTSTTSYTVPAGYHNGSGKVSITTETKTATPSTSSQSITPSSGKVLSKVTVNAISTQEKTITSSRSAQTVTPDSGKYLSKVTVNKYPDATGTFTTSTNSSAVDMGTTNNYRYVNTTGVYNAGKNLILDNITIKKWSESGQAHSYTILKRGWYFSYNLAGYSMTCQSGLIAEGGHFDYLIGSNVCVKVWHLEKNAVLYCNGGAGHGVALIVCDDGNNVFD